jgi:UDP-N-acetylmuramoyl-tripeptide--D-alanyl-D-alanine ligase
MTPWTLADVAAVTGGVLDAASGEEVVTSAAIDSRQVRGGGLFVAFRGERTDGHDHVADAVAQGATGVLAEHAVGAPAVVVPDTTAALGRLAAGQLRRLPDLPVVGVTGSSGKTTTKDLLAVLLSPLGPVVAPPGSFNNDIGLPLTVLRCDETTRALVLEYGARGIGHIARLVAVAQPTVSIVLNVGTAHIGEFGTREATAAAKSELLHGARVAVVNADDPLVAAMPVAPETRVVRFGTAPEADVRATDITTDAHGRASFTVAGHRLGLRLVGAHQVHNALAALAAARVVGVSDEAARSLLAEAEPSSRWRMEVHERPDGVTVVNDAYNANPESMKAAITTVRAMTRGTGRRTWAVLAEMGELGADSRDHHHAVGRFAAAEGVDRVIVIGSPDSPVAALHAAAGERSVQVGDIDAALDLLRAELRPGDLVLVKASRLRGLERLAQALVDDGSGT